MVEYALQVVFLHVTWLFKNFSEDDVSDEMRVSALVEKRDRAVEIFERLALKEMSNAAVSVKRMVRFVAFHFEVEAEQHRRSSHMSTLISSSPPSRRNRFLPLKLVHSTSNRKFSIAWAARSMPPLSDMPRTKRRQRRRITKTRTMSRVSYWLPS